MKPLDGILVVSIEQAVAAPLCSSRLAAAGARVIKIERQEGDFARRYDTAAEGESSYFVWLNQGKESVCLNFKQEGDAGILWAMLQKADVLIQNLSPGALDRAGFSTDVLQALNPGLIVCNISGYGMEGDVAAKPAYDLLVQAESGLISVSGSSNEPGRIGVSICDIGAGLTAYSAVLEALLKRAKTGAGEEISVSLFDVAAEWMAVPFIHAEYGDGAPKPAGLRHPSIAPYGAFECADSKLVLISIQNEREWQRLCKDALQAPELLEQPNYVSNNDRVLHRDDLERDIMTITRTMTSEMFQNRLTAARIAYGAINSPADLAAHPAFRAKEFQNTVGASMNLPAHPVVRQTGDAETSQCPSIGAHTRDVIAEFMPGDG